MAEAELGRDDKHRGKLRDCNEILLHQPEFSG